MIVDVALVAALQEEYDALEKMLRELGGHPIPNGADYKIMKIPSINEDTGKDNSISVVLIAPTDMGQLNAATAISRVLYDLQIRVALLSGIAGCLLPRTQDDARLGDVVLSTKIIDYEMEKITANAVRKRDVIHNVNPILIKKIREQIKLWPEPGRQLPLKPDGQIPRLLFGEVFSGNQVIANSQAKENLLARNDKAIAVEMEAAGIAAMLRAWDLPDRTLMIKVFSDWADDQKDAEPERRERRQYACDLSAEAIRFLLCHVLPNYISPLRVEGEDQRLFKKTIDKAFGSFFGYHGMSPFIKEMAAAVCDAAVKEMSALAAVAGDSSKRYEARVGSGSQYLLRAEPFFANASRIYATSLDSVSTFWIDRKNRTIARTYIMSHGRDVTGRNDDNFMRLFVFSTPDSAHAHARVLDFHCKKFPNTFVCASDRYEELLGQLVPIPDDTYSKKDFALLEFPEHKQKCFADLDGDVFSLQRARSPEERGEVDIVELARLFNEWAKLDAGKFDPEQKILKWEPQCWRDHSGWAEALRGMFGEPTADVFHIVTFDLTDAEYKQLRPTLADLKRKILGDLGKKHGVRDVWLTQLMRNRNVADEVSGGRLHYEAAREMGYALIMRFADSERLDGFMRDETHLKLRLDVFEKLKTRARDLMAEFKISSPNDLRNEGPTRGKVIYEALESLAASRMHRYDYSEDWLIDELVRSNPPDF